MLNLGVD
ncbi:hypothetical protein CP061683_1303B, partial [Chlamydia psittaci 06-1683]